ncbi:DUF6851 domain-containing protein [Salibacter halophilus]|uniref:DUF6851 domain-containing protein n=1 Tax=Salibacter halophilus TaxID=1803916 RepID=UPI00167356A5|nr:T9SS type A sorting domain-containing protein [Salibacter halophilus]
MIATGACYGQSQNSHSIARVWNDALIESIRNDFARPTVHARNLYHLSVASYDAWAAYDPAKETVFLDKSFFGYQVDFSGVVIPQDTHSARVEAISFACYRLLMHRFQNSPGYTGVVNRSDSIMQSLNFDVSNTSTDYVNGGPAEFGNYLAQEIINYGHQDGSNEQNGYANNYYQQANPPIAVEQPGNPNINDPNRWQAISLTVAIDQAGNPVQSTPPHLSPEWGDVDPFALPDTLITVKTRNNNDYNVYMDPGGPSLIDTTDTAGLSSLYKWNFCMVSVWQSHNDPNDTTMWDISPASRGNISGYPLNNDSLPNFYNFFDGGVNDPNQGYSVNPKTGQPYTPQIVPRGDYVRVLAEFWADGIDSETPPGHWFEIMKHTMDDTLFQRKWMGQGPVLSDLEFDVKAFLALGGAVHDAAVVSWSIKGWYDFIRPVSAIRYMAEKGQCTDTTLSNFHPAGIPLIPGYIEVVQPGDSLAGQNQQHVGKIKLYTWRGPDHIGDPNVDIAGVGWILAENWWPYQRPTFVTPPFAGYVSGHSTFSSAAAEVLTQMTGDPFFPGGMGTFDAPQNDFLHFEEGPSVDIQLEWATYKDAADECSLSRIWGGIHPPVDDIDGRKMGMDIGDLAITKADEYVSRKRPAAVAITSSDLYVSRSDIGTSLACQVTFDEKMDTTKLPTINYLTDNPLTVALDSVNYSWIDTNIVELNYHVNNSMTELDSITVEVSGAEDHDGVKQTPRLFRSPFRVDTKKPEVVSVSVADSILNSKSGPNKTIEIVFSEPMNTSSMVQTGFVFPSNIQQDLSYSSGPSYWADSLHFIAHFNTQDLNNEYYQTMFVVSSGSDQFGNPLKIDTTNNVVIVDTREPVLVENTINDTALIKSDIGQNALTINLVFDEVMDTSIKPALSFSDSAAQNALTQLYPLCEWLNDSTYKVSFSLNNTSYESHNLSVVIDSVVDFAANSPQQQYVPQPIHVDTKQPTIVFTGVTADTIFDTHKGLANYEMEFGFDESMDTTQLPAISTSVSSVDAGSMVYNPFESQWLNDSILIARFNIQDHDIEVEHVDVTVNYAKDLLGNSQSQGAFYDQFYFDTRNPHVLSAMTNTSIVNNGTDKLSAIIVFDEDMSSSVIPELSFSDTSVNSAFSIDYNASMWLNNTTYKLEYSINQQTLWRNNLEIYLEKGSDLAGNTVVIDTVMSEFEVDLAATGINMNNPSGDIRVYPNPVKNGQEVIVELHSNISRTGVALKNVAGKTILNQTLVFENSRSGLKMSNIDSGIYFLTLYLENGPVTLKLVIVD